MAPIRYEQLEPVAKSTTCVNGRLRLISCERGMGDRSDKLAHSLLMAADERPMEFSLPDTTFIPSWHGLRAVAVSKKKINL
jgi:hypothetical protein